MMRVGVIRKSQSMKPVPEASFPDLQAVVVVRTRIRDLRSAIC